MYPSANIQYCRNFSFVTPSRNIRARGHIVQYDISRQRRDQRFQAQGRGSRPALRPRAQRQQRKERAPLRPRRGGQDRKLQGISALGARSGRRRVRRGVHEKLHGGAQPRHIRIFAGRDAGGDHGVRPQFRAASPLRAGKARQDLAHGRGARGRQDNSRAPGQRARERRFRRPVRCVQCHRRAHRPRPARGVCQAVGRDAAARRSASRPPRSRGHEKTRRAYARAPRAQGATRPAGHGRVGVPPRSRAHAPSHGRDGHGIGQHLSALRAARSVRGGHAVRGRDRRPARGREMEL